MPVKVAPTLSRGVLRPSYYTSSLFVEPMREDILELVTAFVDAYSSEPLEPEKPFKLFKKVWADQGWHIVHLKVLDDYGRHVFLQTVVRLFIERLDSSDSPLIRLGALFGLYTFFTIQPTDVRLETLDSITLTIDTYERLLAFPAALKGHLSLYATYIISHLVSKQLFEIIPDSSFGPHNPRTLPHSTPLLFHELNHERKKANAIFRAERRQRAEKNVSALETFVSTSDTRFGSSSRMPDEGQDEQPEVPDDYMAKKEQLKMLPAEVLANAEAATVEQIQETERNLRENLNNPSIDTIALERLQGAVKEPGGFLNLVHRNTEGN